MKRKIVALGVVLLTLWTFSSVHAALVWQTTPNPQAFQYAITKNEGLSTTELWAFCLPSARYRPNQA